MSTLSDKKMLVLVSLFAAVLAGCGGGGGGNSSSSTGGGSSSTPSPAPAPAPSLSPSPSPNPSPSPSPAPTIPAVALGKVYIQDFPGGPFNLVNTATGALTPQGTMDCGWITAAAVKPEGTALGTLSDGKVVNFDPVTGLCRDAFTAPEWLDAIAVASDGTMVGQSQATSFGAKTIYRFSSTGAVTGQVPLTGVSALGGFAYANDGKLYGAGIFAVNDPRWYELNPTTGAATWVALNNPLPLARICIDGNNVAYGHSFGTLYWYDPITGAPLGSVVMQRDMGLGAIVCR